MRVFDKVDPSTLGRREWHLWALALSTIVVLGTGLALMMYAAVFSRPVVLTGHPFETLFVSFCLLTLIMIGYLFDRQRVISHLQRKLAVEQSQVMHLEQEVRANLLETLPGFDHFRDRLAMEQRRAASAEQPISLVVVKVKPARGHDSPADVTAILGDAAKGLMRKLRGEDSIYHLEPGAFGILLPRVPTSIALRIQERLIEGLREAAGPEARFSFDMRVSNYPDQAVSAREMEDAVRDFLTAGGKKLSQSESTKLAANAS